MAAQALAAVCVIAVGAHFAGLGYDIMPFADGAVCLVAACVLTAIGSKGGGKAWMAWAILACAVVGVIAARYAFYAASVI